MSKFKISTHAPAGGATVGNSLIKTFWSKFLLTPLREGRLGEPARRNGAYNFYSRPCGRGDRTAGDKIRIGTRFLLTPLREGRLECELKELLKNKISTHAPAGGATARLQRPSTASRISTHAPAGGATAPWHACDGSTFISTHAPAGGATLYLRRHSRPDRHFYSRPCGRGDATPCRTPPATSSFLLTPLREGRLEWLSERTLSIFISTHAPAGGATISEK